MGRTEGKRFPKINWDWLMDTVPGACTLYLIVQAAWLGLILIMMVVGNSILGS